VEKVAWRIKACTVSGVVLRIQFSPYEGGGSGRVMLRILIHLERRLLITGRSTDKADKADKADRPEEQMNEILRAEIEQRAEAQQTRQARQATTLQSSRQRIVKFDAS